MNPKVDSYLDKVKKWQDELIQLRSVVLYCNLIEELKWGVPCYTFNGGNIVLIHAFKEYCALLFMKGALLADSNGILIQQTENVQSGRQIRFTSLKEIIDQESTLKAYIFEAIEVEKAGLKIEFKKTEDFTMPEEFQTVLDENEPVKVAFEALTPGRQKAYLLHFSSAKQAETRGARIEKNLARILKGIGINDCTCGLSKRKPNCDGSHKLLKA
jgi:uncharacterized protein YdeI (YjbR/CyaY-like superfamily)